MFDWESKTKYEGTYVGHNFVFRLAKDENIVVDSIADLFRLGNGDESAKDSGTISRRSLLLFELASVKIKGEMRRYI